MNTVPSHSTLERSSRQDLHSAETVVIKLGSRVLVTKSGYPDENRIRLLVKDIADLKRSGKKVLLVSSGAIAAGVEALGFRTRPGTVPELQMSAAVGQVHLMRLYSRFFEEEGIPIAQVLLTHTDLQDRVRHLNARNTLMMLLRRGIIPVVNENDVVAVDEIKFGDNDMLASLVTILVGGDLLILLSTTNGLRAPTSSGRTKRVVYSETVTDEMRSMANGRGSEFSSGGMESKLSSAAKAVNVGAMVVIADGRRPHAIPHVIAGEDLGTLIGNSTQSQRRVLRARKLWLAFFHKVYGNVIVDDGAKNALMNKGYSLLPIGIRVVEGNFSRGSLVNVRSMDGVVIAQGLTGYSSDEIRKIMGRKSSEISQILGMKDCDEVIHRDNLVVKVTQQGDQNGIA